MDVLDTRTVLTNFRSQIFAIPMSSYWFVAYGCTQLHFIQHACGVGVSKPHVVVTLRAVSQFWFPPHDDGSNTRMSSTRTGVSHLQLGSLPLTTIYRYVHDGRLTRSSILYPTQAMVLRSGSYEWSSRYTQPLRPAKSRDVCTNSDSETTSQPTMSYRDPDVRGASWDLSIISTLEKGIDTIALSNMRNIHVAQLNTVRFQNIERYTLYVWPSVASISSFRTAWSTEWVTNVAVTQGDAKRWLERALNLLETKDLCSIGMRDYGSRGVRDGNVSYLGPCVKTYHVYLTIFLRKASKNVFVLKFNIHPKILNLHISASWVSTVQT